MEGSTLPRNMRKRTMERYQVNVLIYKCKAFADSIEDPTFNGEEMSERLSQDLSQWKNFNSFIARLTSTGFAPWMNLPIWQLREALEEPPDAGPAMSCRMWVASEWIIHCASPIFQYLDSKEKLSEGSARAIRTGSLYSDKPPLSVERWNFWKKRLSEIASEANRLELNHAATAHILDALTKMDAIE